MQQDTSSPKPSRLDGADESQSIGPETDPGEETVEYTPEGIDAAGEGDEGEGPSVEEQLKAAEDRSLRLQAELQNVLNRSRREVEEVRKYGALGIAKDLLPAIDNIDRALAAAEIGDEEADSGSLANGFRLVREQLIGVLKDHGCEAIDTSPGTAFDPSFHEAILQQPSDEVEAGAIVMAAQSGYKLHDRVVRAAQVIVSSGPASA
ncbi:MAG: nucleotide exchange factor GrpE [Planctomycetota bacterium]